MIHYIIVLYLIDTPTNTKGYNPTNYKIPHHFTGAINALLRLQDVYDLSPHHLVEGTVEGFSSTSKLTGWCSE